MADKEDEEEQLGTTVAGGAAISVEDPISTDMPWDLRVHIFTFLGVVDLCRCARTCRSWYGHPARLPHRQRHRETREQWSAVDPAAHIDLAPNEGTTWFKTQRCGRQSILVAYSSTQATAFSRGSCPSQLSAP